jgi:TRAP-type C4-dicarboxylate transport system substrate-binding protein
VGRLVVSREPPGLEPGAPGHPGDGVADINATALAEREDVARQNEALLGDLAAKGLVFNDVDPAPFRETLRKSGFYVEWKNKFGEEAWALLEEATGKLA